MKTKILNSMLFMFFTVISAYFCFCAFHSEDSEDEVSVIPRISFEQGSEQSLKKVKWLVAIVAFLSEVVVDTFDFQANQGTISAKIPRSTPFTITILGLSDDKSDTLFRGREVNETGITHDLVLSITATMVTPVKPFALVLTKATKSEVFFTWKDNSSNEDGFFLIWKNLFSGIVLDSFKVNGKDVDSVAILRPSESFLYTLKAFNQAGNSPASNDVEWIHNDTVAKPGKLVEPADTYYVNEEYMFHKDSNDDPQCNLKHKLQYRFDWGDGYVSTWKNSPSYYHQWTEPGNYQITMTARCSTYRYVSATSDPIEIFVIE